MKNFLLKLFTWWNSQTFGTQLWTWMYGELVGEDEFGNRYYRTRGGEVDKTLGFERPGAAACEGFPGSARHVAHVDAADVPGYGA